MKESLIEPYKDKFQSILIFGPPGVGKGTLCKFLSGSSTLYHLSSGDIFRGLDPATPAGTLVAKYANQGLLLPDEATLDIWYNYVQGLISTSKYFPKQQYLLLDGIPRTSPQAEMIKKYVDVKAVIVLEVKDSQELINRLKGRALKEKRQDDADENILKTRLDVYKKDTEQVLNHYDKNIIYRINADQRPLEVVKDTLVSLCHLMAYAP